MGLFGGGQEQANGGLNLGVPQQNGYTQSPSPFGQNQGWTGNSAAGAFMQGAGVNSQYMQQPIAPPSEAEILLAMLKSQSPVDRFVVSEKMPMLIQMLNDIVSFSVLDILRNATFKMNEDDGTLKLDPQSLPSNLQTMSGENITSQFNALVGKSQQNIDQAQMEQQQILAISQQSMMGSALHAAMADEGFMQKVGGGIGSFTRNMIGGR
jgi:hypothetical protein